MGFFQPAPPASGGGLTQAEADAAYDPLGAAAAAQAAAATDATTKANAAKARSTHTGTQTLATISDAGTLAAAAPDASTVELSGTTLRVKDAGITRAKGAATFNREVVQVLVGDLTTALVTGDGQAWFIVPAYLNGLKLLVVETSLAVAQSTSGTPTVQVANATQAWDLTTTRPVIAINKWGNHETGGTAAVVDTASSHDVMTTGDRLRFDIDVAGTGSKGLFVTLTFGP